MGKEAPPAPPTKKRFVKGKPTHYAGKRKIANAAMQAKLKAFIAARANWTVREITEAWKEAAPKEMHFERSRIGQIRKALQREWAQEAFDAIGDVTRPILAEMFATAMSKPEDAFRVTNGKVELIPWEELPPGATNALHVGVDGDRPFIRYDPAVAQRAKNDALKFIHGTTIEVRGGGEILKILVELDDVEGLDRLAQGVSPLDVMLQRLQDPVFLEMCLKRAKELEEERRNE